MHVDKEYEIQKALGTLKTYACTIKYYGRRSGHTFPAEYGEGVYNDVLFKTYGPGEQLDKDAREWLADQDRSALFVSVTIMYEIFPGGATKKKKKKKAM